MAKKFRDLTEREILALAISLEEEDARIYADTPTAFATLIPTRLRFSTKCTLRKSTTATALWRSTRAALAIRRQDVKGFIQRRPLWLSRPFAHL